MTTARDKLLDKIKKCLALAKSANEHEAATALRQAHALMRQHGVSDFDVEHADIKEERTRAGVSKRPAEWEAGLATRVADAFDCSVFLMAGYPAGNWVFVGAGPAGEVARYAFEVLYRQAKRARVRYRDTVLRRCTTTRTRRADLFCDGWVIAATALVDQLTGNAAAKARVSAYLEHKYQFATMKVTDRNAGRNLAQRDHGDLYAGVLSGRDARLERGLAVSDNPLQLG